MSNVFLTEYDVKDFKEKFLKEFEDIISYDDTWACAFQERNGQYRYKNHDSMVNLMKRFIDWEISILIKPKTSKIFPSGSTSRKNIWNIFQTYLQANGRTDLINKIISENNTFMKCDKHNMVGHKNCRSTRELNIQDIIKKAKKYSKNRKSVKKIKTWYLDDDDLELFKQFSESYNQSWQMSNKDVYGITNSETWSIDRGIIDRPYSEKNPTMMSDAFKKFKKDNKNKPSIKKQSVKEIVESNSKNKEWEKKVLTHMMSRSKKKTPKGQDEIIISPSMPELIDNDAGRAVLTRKKRKKRKKKNRKSKNKKKGGKRRKMTHKYRKKKGGKRRKSKRRNKKLK